jgi:hemerythrin-like domain-containing protein
MTVSRRAILSHLHAAPLVAAAPMLAACSGGDEDVGAVEDLMREHGVLRRAILVFREVAARLEKGGDVAAPALRQTARLFRTFGEDYHERALEEAHIFPTLRKAEGPGAAYVGVLIAQHNRGRQIIDYVLRVTATGTVGANGSALARALSDFELMYANHAAREDTVVFPAWKKAIGGHNLHEMGEEFEEIEKRQFGGDGFDMAVKQIGAIEAELGLADISQFTAAPPPA